MSMNYFWDVFMLNIQCLFLSQLLLLVLYFCKVQKLHFSERRWLPQGWSIGPIYQVMSSLLDNILKQQSREKLIKSLSSDTDHAVAFSWPALIRNATCLGFKKRGGQRNIIILYFTFLSSKTQKRAITMLQLHFPPPPVFILNCTLILCNYQWAYRVIAFG